MEITNFKQNLSTEGFNKGGVCSFKFCPVEWVETMPLAADGIYIDTITFITGKDWLVGYGTLDTVSWDEDSQGDQLYKPLLKGFVPTDEEDNVALFEAMKGKQYLILATDRHGREVLSGRPDAGLVFGFKRSKGMRQDNKHGQVFEFGGVVLPWPSYYYTS
jgi:hypothetical protein